MADQTTTPKAPIRLTTPRQRLLWGLAMDPGNVHIKATTERTRVWLDEHDLVLWDGPARRWRASIAGWIALLGDENTNTAPLWGDLAQFDAADAENLGKAREQFRAWVTSQEPETPGGETPVQAPVQAPVQTPGPVSTDPNVKQRKVIGADQKAVKPCACSKFWAGTTVDTEGGDLAVENERMTECTAQTARVFAPGHDAKLVAFLVKAELDGLELHSGDGTSGDAESLLRNLHGTALAAKARKAKDRLVRAALAKQARAEAARVGKVENNTQPQVTPEPVEKPEPGNAKIRLLAPSKVQGTEVVARIDTAGNATYAGTNNRRPTISKFGNYEVVERLDSKSEHEVKVEAMQALDAMITDLTSK